MSYPNYTRPSESNSPWLPHIPSESQYWQPTHQLPTPVATPTPGIREADHRNDEIPSAKRVKREPGSSPTAKGSTPVWQPGSENASGPIKSEHGPQPQAFPSALPLNNCPQANSTLPEASPDTGGRSTSPVIKDENNGTSSQDSSICVPPYTVEQQPIAIPNGVSGPRWIIKSEKQEGSQAPPSSSISDAPEAPFSEEPQLCPEQAALVELIASGQNVFYTGSAGCGKSTVLKAFTKRLVAMGKNIRVLAPTGRAALQVNGSTTWTFAGWTPDHHKKPLDELRANAHGKFVFKRLTTTDVVVIDEISMVENHHFERLNQIMKEARRKPHLPDKAFGGAQIIVTGDFCQLPPVRPFQYCMECGKTLAERTTSEGKRYTCRTHGEFRDEDKWAFRSKAWDECNFVHVNLKTIHRQNDLTFIRMLQKCRVGDRLTPTEITTLMDHPCKVHHATKLFATREEVNKINQEAFRKLTGLNHTYWTSDTFIWQRERHHNLQWKNVRKSSGPESQRPLAALDDHRFDECVELKKGMLVVLLVNLDLASGLCNGSQGIICGFDRYDPAKMPRAKVDKNDDPQMRIFGERAVLKEKEMKLFIKGEGAKFKTWPVVRFHNGQIRTIYAECSIAELGDEQPYSLLCRTQIPLAPAWAMTIHKSQSLTLDRVIVNLSRAFEEGQVYVALSRATSLEGLKIEGDAAGLLVGLGGNKQVQRFLRERFGPLNDPYAVGR